MKIETLDEWNRINNGCGCCVMPGSDLGIECQSITIGFRPVYLHEHDGVLYRQLTTRWHYRLPPNQGPYRYIDQSLTTRGWNMFSDLSILVCPELHDRDPGLLAPSPLPEGAQDLGTEALSWSLPFSQGQYESDVQTKLTAMYSAEVGCHGSDCEAKRHWILGNPGGYTEDAYTFVNYRWQIPTTHTGKYFKITWDVVTIPATGDPSLETDLSVVWSGPGTGDQSNDSWYTEWFQLESPSGYGDVRRVVNVRYESYRCTRMGTRPQLFGEGYELPS